MYIEELKSLVYMSNSMGKRVDYVQAGGGNTSVKFNDGYMAIKASGYFLKEMTENVGFVAVNSDTVKRYHEIEHNRECDCNKESMEIAMSSIKQINGEENARPSVEVGFHSILGKFVLHLHPVYANVLLCSKGGIDKALDIVKSAGISCIALPYTMPGYNLVKLMLDAIDDYVRNYSKTPEVIFLKNHGVITHADTSQRAIELMNIVNEEIISALNLPLFPQISIKKDGNRFKSTNEWLIKVLSESDIAQQMTNSPVYPDQLVYTANELSMGSGTTKIVITDNDIIYNTGEKEAYALEEVMTALAYLYYCIGLKGLELELLSQDDCANILGWDSEKYRKKLMSGK